MKNTSMLLRTFLLLAISRVLVEFELVTSGSFFLAAESSASLVGEAVTRLDNVGNGLLGLAS